MTHLTDSLKAPQSPSRRQDKGPVRHCQQNAPIASVCVVARPYRDPVEILTAPVPAQSPFIPVDAKIVVGAVAPASPDPIPIVLLPGFEYRLAEWRNPETHEVHWRMERRRAAQYGEDDE